jgi:hypothetical protein
VQHQSTPSGLSDSRHASRAERGLGRGRAERDRQSYGEGYGGARLQFQLGRGFEPARRSIGC